MPFPHRWAVIGLLVLLWPLWQPPRDVAAADLNEGLVGRWPLAGNARDDSGRERHAVAHGIDWQAEGRDGKAGGAGGFDGRSAYLELPAASLPRLAKQDFSVALWAAVAERQDDVPGDLVSQYDARRRRGFHLSIKTNAGVTFNQANYRHLQFGIDDDRVSPWTDCGRPGDGLLAFAMAVHDGQLYAGVCRPAAGESGRVYRYLGATRWEDCGAPDASNTVTALAVFNGQLYAGTGKYRLAGSALAESENAELGGRIFRHEAPDRWVDCGRLPDRDAVAGLVVFRGRLYAASLYKPAGFFRYEGESRWTECALPGERRVESLGVFNGHLYATTYDGGRVYRFDGESWTDCGQLGEEGVNTQTYAFAVYQGRLHVGTWPSGRVYRLEAPGRWTDLGRLGQELEVMGMLVYNGRLLAGTLPLAEVYSFESDGAWQRLRQLDATPEVKYRRAWTMAEYQGRLFCSTLPSGKVHAFDVGQNVSTDREVPAGWRHLAAIKRGGVLQLYVDGQRAAESMAFAPAAYDLSTERPLFIGRGENDFFQGRLADVRLYQRALTAEEVAELAAPRK